MDTLVLSSSIEKVIDLQSEVIMDVVGASTFDTVVTSVSYIAKSINLISVIESGES